MKKLFLLLLTVAAFALSASAQTRTVQGTVVYAGDGEPLAGATILPVGGGNGVATDLDGKFTLTVPAKVTKLNVSYVGMLTQQVNITAGDMLIQLTNSENSLDEVMVVAYGTEKKSAFTGSASVIKADALEDRLVSNVTNALAGAVAGVQTLSSNGQPGTSSTVRIRGVGSINAGASPLYVLDGVPYDGDIAAINPTDIESMTVLKDAASAALYGARGANGVILITTKKGSVGDAKITFDARWGANSRQVPNYDVIENPNTYMEMLYQAHYNAAYYRQGMSASAAHVYANQNLFFGEQGGLGYQMYTIPEGELLIGADGKINPNASLGWSNGKYYFTPDNWSDNVYRNGLRQEYNLSISGGNEKLDYYVSGSFLEDEGVIDNSSFSRYSTRASVNYQAKKWLKIGTNMSYAYTESKYPGEQTSDYSSSSMNAFAIANTLAPVYPMFVRNADGSIAIDEITGHPVYDYGDAAMSTGYTRNYMSQSNPTSDLIYNSDKYLSDIFNGKWYAQVTPIEGLTVTGTLSLMVDNTRFNSFSNKRYGQSKPYGGTVTQESARYSGFNQQYLANYKKTFANVHNIDILVGYESYDYRTEGHWGYGTNTYLDNSYVLDNIIDSKNVGGSRDEYSTRGYIGRANYNYDTKYYASVSFRRDASSRFHPDNRWGNFWSISAAWDLAKESFLKDKASWVDMLKLKASFGQQGNDDIQNYYAYVDQFQIKGSEGVWSDGVLAYKGNKDLTWETSNSFNVGVDFSLWKNKLSGTIEYFNRDIEDMLYYKPVAPSNGYTSIPMNIGSMRNYGAEIELIYRPIETRNITWDINLNATFWKNKVLELAPELNGEWISGSRIFREGESMYQLYIPKYAGVDSATGLALFYAREEIEDEAGNVVGYGDEYVTSDYRTAYNTNRQTTGNLLPDVYGGFGTTLNAYGFDLSLQFSYQLGGKIYDSGYAGFMHTGYYSNVGKNWHKDALNAWTASNTNTDVPRLDINSQYDASSSDRWLTNSNYLALNNITIGYTLPNSITKKLGVEQLRIYGTADNVALWSARKGLDPRQSFTTATSSTYTTMRSISGGIKLVF